jgi:hypothetical protein
VWALGTAEERAQRRQSQGRELHWGGGIHEGTRLLAVTGARGVCRSELWVKDWMWVFSAAKDDEMRHGH